MQTHANGAGRGTGRRDPRSCVGFPMFAEVDAAAVAESTGASMQTGDRSFLHATGFLISPEGKIATAVCASGPIGRVTPSEILRTVIFARSHAK